jgi:hypothetical protein
MAEIKQAGGVARAKRARATMARKKVEESIVKVASKVLNKE